MGDELIPNYFISQGFAPSRRAANVPLIFPQVADQVNYPNYDFFSQRVPTLVSPLDPNYEWAKHGAKLGGSHNFVVKGKPVLTNFSSFSNEDAIGEVGNSMIKVSEIGMFSAELHRYIDSIDGKALKEKDPVAFQARLVKMAKDRGLAYAEGPDEEPTAEKLIEFLQDKGKAELIFNGLFSTYTAQRDLMMMIAKRKMDDVAYNQKVLDASQALAKSARAELA